MAEKTRKLNATAFAYVKPSKPTTHYTPSGTTWYALYDVNYSYDYTAYFYIQFASWPSSLKHNRLLGLKIVLPARCVDRGTGETEVISDKFDLNTTVPNGVELSKVTYDSHYSENHYIPSSDIPNVVAGETKNVTIDASDREVFAGSLLRNNRILSIGNKYGSLGATLYTRATLIDGTTVPSVTIRYDDSTYYTCSARVTYPENLSTINPGVPLTVKWSLERDFVADPSDWVQKSAVFYWRSTTGGSDEQAWHSISISGNTKQVTIPAKTLPNGKTIQYYITVVDELNNSHYASNGTASSPLTLVTQAVKPVPVKPANNITVDPASELQFSWTLASTGGTQYDQEWAKIIWIDDPDAAYDEDTWNSFVLRTADKSYTSPAHFFPSGKTIQWRLAAEATETYVDGNGWLSDTIRKFTTVPYTLNMVQSPSGNNVCPGEPITFSYTISNTMGGEALQTESKLYWRTSTQDPYTVIQNSTAVKEIIVPAGTFPTGSSVQWYVEATISDGTVFSTNPASFSTATSQIVPQSSPTAGYTDPRHPILFSWYFAAGSGSVTGAASLFWKVSTAENYTEVTTTGNSITIPANTFPVASTIQWYLSGQDYSGHESQTDVFDFSTAAAAIRAITKYPVNGTVDGSEAITFRWEFESADGFTASRVAFDWKLPSEDSQHWHNVFDVNEVITQYTMPENTFSPGQIDWRIRAWNIDSVLGLVGTASFICMIAPTIVVASATPVPFSTISWQVNDQQSYEIMVDGNRLGPYFGTEKRFELPYYLEDGVHQIKVRVMGSLGMWSQWKETGVSISNASESSITLTGSGSTDAVLQWSTESAVQNFYVYRSNTAIARTNKLGFTDKMATGDQTYFVINKLADGNYDKSNEVMVSLKVDFVNVSSVDGSKTIEIIHTLKSKKNPEFKKTLTTEFHQLSGHTYPFVVSSSFLEEPVDISAVFLYNEEEERKTFESLFGTAVVVKTPDGSCFVGFIDGWQKKPVSGYYISYTLTIRRIDWEDFIDDTE